MSTRARTMLVCACAKVVLAISAFIKSKSFPLVGVIGPDNYQKYLERGFNFVWIFLGVCCTLFCTRRGGSLMYPLCPQIWTAPTRPRP